MLRRVALVRTDVSEELSASFIRVTRIDELETTLAVTNNRCTQRGPSQIIQNKNFILYTYIALFMDIYDRPDYLSV
jgi:hypothetical protein